MENVLLIVVSIIFIVCAAVIMGGKIELMHSYHIKNITEETRKPYGRVVGAGLLVIGAGILLDGVLSFFIDNAKPVTVVSLIIGLGIIFYGQFKYNKGIF